ncbi:MAG: sulfatase [Ardenticatenaceae bacterium]|nr:sulfatase [Ardenticatenaceae bacterium]MCB9442806.1 sulfatase [Ardenticatenaceae bacterium]
MQSRPDIIFIVLDTQRADRLGCYGHETAVTPHLDQFARQSVLFEQAISPAQWTIPSHASMFTGLYPTTHQVTQSSQSLGPDTPHLAELLAGQGYETIGFCNNPLVGILNNGFKRGFKTFYNYGGAFPSVPHESSRSPWPLKRLTSAYTQFLRRISYPIQNFFGQSDLAFRISLNAWLTPLWSKYANFKGQNARSVRDVSHFLRQRDKRPSSKPLFLFLNLMETHLPFWPPAEFVNKVAPYMQENEEARRIMAAWNRESFRWPAPLAEPLGELESRVLSDMYDAEVAYQDDYLGELLGVLNGRANQHNTLTLIVADHGDGLGEHNFMGHAFVAYQELVHVPLLMQWPERIARPERVTTPVSTRRVFHTMLDAAGCADCGLDEANELTLLHTVNGRDPEQNTAYSEIYPPMNFVRTLEKNQPDLLESYRCLAIRRAAVCGDAAQPARKLIQVDEEPDELFNLTVDPLELQDEMAQFPEETAVLHRDIKRMAQTAKIKREDLAAGTAVDLDDKQLRQQLRSLGYLD